MKNSKKTQEAETTTQVQTTQQRVADKQVKQLYEAAVEKNKRVSLYGKHNLETKLEKSGNLAFVWVTEIDKPARTTTHIYHENGTDINKAPRIFARPMTAEEKAAHGLPPKSKLRLYQVLDGNGKLVQDFVNVYLASAFLKQMLKK